MHERETLTCPGHAHACAGLVVVCRSPYSARVSLVIYYDFTSAESFALSEIVRGLEDVQPAEWRGVQMEPGLPDAMEGFDRWALGRVEMELVTVRKQVPDLRLELPSGRPNTRRALQAVASVARVHATRADALRTLLFQEYWWNGADLSDGATLKRIADAAGVPPWIDLANPAAQAAQVGWELDWQTEHLGGVPRIIRSDGQILWTISDAAAAREFVTTG